MGTFEANAIQFFNDAELSQVAAQRSRNRKVEAGDPSKHSIVSVACSLKLVGVGGYLASPRAGCHKCAALDYARRRSLSASRVWAQVFQPAGVEGDELQPELFAQFEDVLFDF